MAQPQFVFDRFGRVLRQELGGLGDTALTMGKNMAMQPVAGLSGMMEYGRALGTRLGGGGDQSGGLLDFARGPAVDSAVDAINRTQSLAGGPQTTEGERNLEAIGSGMGLLLDPLTRGVDAAGEQSPLAGAILAGAGAAVDPSKLSRVGKLGLLGAESVAKFGNKAAREAALAKKVEAAAAAAATDAPVDAATNAKAAKRVKVEPDVYRQMAIDQGDGATLAAIQRGDHLKPDGSGGYIGAPRTVDSPQALGGMRLSLDRQFRDAAQMLSEADYNRLGTWYDRAKGGISMSVEPYQLDNVLNQHSVYSAGVSPESELGFSLKHHNSRVLGDPVMAYRGAPMEKLDYAMTANVNPKLGFKIGEYREKNDPRVPNGGLFGVNDFRAAQGFGYTTPDGKIWKGGVSATMHPFMDGETALIGARANRDAVGGRTDWAGPHIQELPWVLGKAEDIYRRGKKSRFAGAPEEGMAAALRDANNTAQDYFNKHVFSGTYEVAPGASTGHAVQSYADMAPDQRKAYDLTGRWDTPAPEGLLSDAPDVGAGNRDAIYRALGLRTLPTLESSGMYTNMQGVAENNNAYLARALADFPTGGGGGRISPLTSNALDFAERFRGVNDAQEAYAGNLPNTMNGVKAKNTMLLDTRAANGSSISGVQPTSDQLQAINRELQRRGLTNDYGVSATNRGAVVFPFDPATKPADSNKVYSKAFKAKLAATMPDAEQVKGVASTVYGPAIGRWGPKGVEPTAPFTGEATMGLLSAGAELPQTITRNIGESEEIRNILRQKIARDEGLPDMRRDIQNTRNFFAEADWPKAVELIRKGMAPAAALAALGYSASSMAGEQPRP
ncbi:hypothetical protein UFOVP73_7 [uncultured Caudovirales phage]|uniref:Uncharacterized protein n=1 Tax=uncultured Caudovirales phage TaxID=2100421 RepID=A0A6J5KXN8_9CAUD|nr:hypothetical protein UFOVP73_7 [uncultured Caudovirales phage]CAB5194872.1 hypothetical protein UFOVP170_29 [uncultured Caudovirales phage]